MKSTKLRAACASPAVVSTVLLSLAAAGWWSSRPPSASHLTRLGRATVPSCAAAQMAAAEWGTAFMTSSNDWSIDWWLSWHSRHARFDLLPPSWVLPPGKLRTYGPPEADGHKLLWDVSYLPTDEPCVVYSFGGNLQVEFEDAMLSATHCKVWQFDCTVDPNAMAPLLKRYGGRLTFLSLCVGQDGDTLSFDYAGRRAVSELKSIATVTAALGHVREVGGGAAGVSSGGHGIDILKLDVEGAEHHVIPDFLESASYLPSQISLEVYFLGGQGSSDFRHSLSLFHSFFKAGYVLISEEVNPIAGPNYVEFTFLRGCGWEERV